MPDSSLQMDGALVPRDRGPRYLAFFCASLVVLCYAPLLLLHFRRLWGSEHYQHFPLVLAAICSFAWSRFHAASPASYDASAAKRTGGQLVALLLLAAAVLVWSPWLAAVSAICMLGTAVLDRDRLFRQLLLPVWLLLWLLVPLPFGWDYGLTTWLQGVSSRAGSSLLDLLGHNHLLAGHVIEVPGRQFLVEEACSGIRSVFVLVACAALFAVVSRRQWCHALPLIAAAVLLSVAMNVVRIVCVVMLNGELGIDVTHGWRHDTPSAALFAVAVLLLMSADQLLLGLQAPVPIDQDEDLFPEEEEDELEPAPAETVLPARVLARRMPTWVTASCGLLFMTQLSLLTADRIRDPERSAAQYRPLSGIGESSLLANCAEWTRESYELVTRERNSDYGRFSNMWTFQRDGTTAIVSLDHPFTSWHPLEQCYRGLGWSVASRQVVTADRAIDPLQHPFVQIELERPTGESALLLFCLFDRHSTPLVAPATEVSLTSSLRRLIERVDTTLSRLGLSELTGPVSTITPTYQFQVLASRPRGLSSDERQQAVDLFIQARQSVRGDWQGDG